MGVLTKKLQSDGTRERFAGLEIGVVQILTGS